MMVPGEPMTTGLRDGVLVYASDLETMARFYEQVLGMTVRAGDAAHSVLSAPGAVAGSELVIHAIPAHIAATFTIRVPPEPREEQAFKPLFTVTDLTVAEQRATALGGCVLGERWDGPGYRARNVCDPEGNISQLRELRV